MRAGATVAVAVCLLGAARGASAQSDAAPHRPSAEPASARPLHLSGVTPEAPMSFGLPRPVWLPQGWTFGVDVPRPCAGCAAAGPIVFNGNAPWTMRGTLRYSGDGAAFGITVTGQRGARLPLYMTPSSGPARPAAASEADVGDTRTQWVLSLDGERRLFGDATGPSLSIVGSVFAPITTIGRTFTPTATASGLERAPAIAQGAVFGGLRVRF